MPVRHLNPSLLVSLAAAACVSEGDVRAPRGEGPTPGDVRVTDRAVQVAQPEVDVLFVVDDSCSMAEEQHRLAANYPIFTDFYRDSGVDYHLGVVSMDMEGSDAGRLRRADGHRWIDPSTPDPEGVFGRMTRLGTGGSGVESGRAAAWTALEALADRPSNMGFLRDAAELHIVFISDEDDATVRIPSWSFQDWLTDLKAEAGRVRVHALVWPDGVSCPEGHAEGLFYERYAAWTQGIVGNICDPDWTPFMEELGLRTAGFRVEFPLSEVPDPETLLVRVERVDAEGRTTTRHFRTCAEQDRDDACDVEYRHATNTVRFLGRVPGPLSEVVIDYLRADSQASVSI